MMGEANALFVLLPPPAVRTYVPLCCWRVLCWVWCRDVLFLFRLRPEEKVQVTSYIRDLFVTNNVSCSGCCILGNVVGVFLSERAIRLETDRIEWEAYFF